MYAAASGSKDFESRLSLAGRCSSTQLQTSVGGRESNPNDFRRGKHKSFLSSPNKDHTVNHRPSHGKQTINML